MALRNYVMGDHVEVGQQVSYLEVGTKKVVVPWDPAEPLLGTVVELHKNTIGDEIIVTVEVV